MKIWDAEGTAGARSRRVFWYISGGQEETSDTSIQYKEA